MQEVTPAQAAAWLASNPHKRPLDENRAAGFAARMKAGGWAEHARGCRAVELLDTGMLLNGQHRLAAVVRAGIPVRMRVVVYGTVPDDAESP